MTPQAIKALNDSKPVVLVIDDSIDVHRLLRVRLRSEGIDLCFAQNGPEGIELAVKQKPTAILLDLDMPDMDGFQVLRQLKEKAETFNIPVIVLSGLHSTQDKVTAFDLGAMDYITKPFELTELRVRVRSAIRLCRLLEMLGVRAQLDGLTALWNRAYFDERWTNEFSRAARYGHPLCVALLDVDHFKSVNDTFGHPAGDAVLQGFAKLIQRESRASDIACRYGGEEFVLIMPDTAPGEASTVCERIRAALEQVTWPSHPERRVTVSIGAAGFAGGTTVKEQQLLELADKALYSAKRSGRNRVVITDASLALARNAG
ncbi:MAG: diguanylate cyclase [Planctomycetota bacterium]|nr:diguanylate cyclase [Planctomycetota bacterium]